MGPLRMSEEDANALLAKWEPADVGAQLDTRRLHRGELHHPAIEVLHLWTKSTTIYNGHEQASKLRQYLERLLLLSCCRGFDPEENPSFWRRYFADRMSVVTHRITRGVFASIEVTSEPDVDPEIIATTLGVLLSATQASSVRCDVKRELQLYLERVPPPLEIKLFVDVWHSLLQTRRALQRFASQTTSDACSAVRLVVGSRHPLQRNAATGEDIKELFDIAAMRCVRIEGIHLTIHADWNADLRALMRELVRRNTVQAMSWEFTCHPDNVAALCSALPELTALTSLALVCLYYPRGDVTDSSEARDSCALWEWVTYALMQRKRRGLSLSLEFRVTASATQAIEDAYRRTNSLEMLVPVAQFAPEVPIFLPHGATAMLAQGTIADPLGEVAGVASVIIHAPQRVDVIAQCGSKAVVVVPGIGLLTTPLSTLESWHQAASRRRYRPARDGFLVDSLVCHDSDPKNVVKILKVFGVNLTHLGFVLCARIKARELQNILLECPKLTKLAVEFGTVATLEPLIDAYNRHETHIETLICQPESYDETIMDEEIGGSVEQCVDALATPGHPMASIAKELHFETIGLRPHVLTRLRLAVQENKRLEFLCVSMRDEDFPEHDQTTEFLGMLGDQPLLQNERSRLALYTFLLVVRRKRVLREVPMPCLALVAQFAAIPVRRCVSRC